MNAARNFRRGTLYLTDLVGLSDSDDAGLHYGNFSDPDHDDDDEDFEDDPETSPDADAEEDKIGVGIQRTPEKFFRKRADLLKIKLKCAICRTSIAYIKDPQVVFCSRCRKVHHFDCFRRQHVEIDENSSGSEDDIGPVSTPLTEHLWVLYILDSNRGEKSMIKAHARDVYTKWFGVPHEQAEPKLLVWPRLDDCFSLCEPVLSANSDTNNHSNQVPSLISFFGDTGTGKSTIIKALLKLQRRSGSIEVPVTGSTNMGSRSNMSTSGDVHLYPDHATINGPNPMLYADCEGTRGFSQPYASKLPSFLNVFGASGNEILTAIKQHDKLARRAWPLKWEQIAQVKDTEVWRKEVVRNLYPRFLYVFSDVVCYVTNNSRMVMDHLTQLVEWANIGFDTTLNQRLRPSLVLIVNNDNNRSSEDVLKKCDIQHATNQILEVLIESEWFESQKALWRTRGRKIKNSSDLLACYYDTIDVVQIPSDARVPVAIILQQYKKLYELLVTRSVAARRRRTMLGMKTTREDRSLYMDIALQQLAQDFESPIDLHGIVERVRRSPSAFQEHLLTFLTQYVSRTGSKRSTSATLENLKVYVASCIASRVLEADEATRSNAKDETMRQCLRALDQFYNHHWLCEKVVNENELCSDPGVSTLALRCLNFLDGHTKGHQFQRSGTLGRFHWLVTPYLLVGEFEADFDVERYVNAIDDIVQACLSQGKIATYGSLAREATARKIGLVKSNTTCLGCLARRPIWMLPCEHMLCEECLRRFGCLDTLEERVTHLVGCPFGDSSAEVTFALKPCNAAARTLALDGGGVRGILELLMLKELERHVGFGIEVQDMFDLVIGTSTGAIVGLGVFQKRWSTTQAIQKFKELSQKAFQRRYSDRWLIKHIFSIFYSYTYDSKGINSALKEAFGTGKDTVFYGPLLKSENFVRVGAVVTSNDGPQQMRLLSNYQREWSAENMPGIATLQNAQNSGDWLQRERLLKNEMLCWEVARASSAAPTYFQEFQHEGTNRTYRDGGLQYNNPAAIVEWERRLIWPKSAQQMPDIVLSIGAGLSKTKPARSKHHSWLKWLPKRVATGLTTMLQMTESTLDCEQKWKEVYSYTAGNLELRSRYERLNVLLSSTPCELDDIGAISSLEQNAATFLSRSSKDSYNPAYSNCWHQLQAIAGRIISTLFYFNVTDWVRPTDVGMPWKVKGQLRCRLRRQSKKQFLELLDGDERGPCIFRVRDHVGNAARIPVASNMWDPEHFLANIEFAMHQRHASIFIEMKFADQSSIQWRPISAFPRMLEDASMST